METEFTPIASVLGGALIGLSAVLLMGLHGKIMGATGILAGALSLSGQDRMWRYIVLAGMVCGPFMYIFLTGGFPAIDVPVSRTALMIGGFIVGIGVTFGSGCTSGHGVCGIARLSPRSFVATITFMISTGLTVFIIRHVIGV